MDDTIKRLKAYEAAGADALMAPGLPDLEAVRAVCAAVGGYTRKHNPWVDFADVPAEDNRPMSDFPTRIFKRECKRRTASVTFSCSKSVGNSQNRIFERAYRQYAYLLGNNLGDTRQAPFSSINKLANNQIEIGSDDCREIIALHFLREMF